MARANLHINKQLEEAFRGAQSTSSKVRAIKVTIVNEDICYTSSIDIVSTAASDFDSKLTTILSTSEAAMIIYRLTDAAGL
jgi:hypothetical protein